MELYKEIDKKSIAAIADTCLSVYQSEDWQRLSENGWRTYEVYEDGVCMMYYQKYLH